MAKKLKLALAAIIVCAAGIYLNNSNLLAARHAGKPVLLAHRGVAQRFDERDLKNDTCTAARMLPPVHDYLENTIRSMQASWTGIVPEACHNAFVLVPINVAPWLWGWPDRLLDRMAAVNSTVFVLGPYQGGEFSTGIDTPGLWSRLPGNYSGGVWTNEIEIIARLAHEGN